MGIADGILPPDRADQAPVTGPLRELLRLMTRGEGHRPSIEIACDPDAYDKLRTYFQRPYRGRPTTFALTLAEGTVWFQRASYDASYEEEQRLGEPWLHGFTPDDAPQPQAVQKHSAAEEADVRAAVAEFSRMHFGAAMQEAHRHVQEARLPCPLVAERLGPPPTPDFEPVRPSFGVAVSSTAPGGAGTAEYVGKYREPK